MPAREELKCQVILKNYYGMTNYAQGLEMCYKIQSFLSGRNFLEEHVTVVVELHRDYSTKSYKSTPLTQVLVLTTIR